VVVCVWAAAPFWAQAEPETQPVTMSVGLSVDLDLQETLA
jgi:hypothetical protein